MKQVFVSDYNVPSARTEQESQRPLQVTTEYDQASLAFDSRFLKRLNKVSSCRSSNFVFIIKSLRVKILSLSVSLIKSILEGGHGIFFAANF